MLTLRIDFLPMLRAYVTLIVLAVTVGHGADAAQRPNILLITIDTLRADRLGRPGVTPTLDALAARGTRFALAYAHAPTTLSSHASILTGLLPPSHGVRNNGAFRLDGSASTLAEALKGAGYATGAFVSAFVVSTRYGLDQGFDVYDDRMPSTSRRTTGVAFRFTERHAPETLAAAATWIGHQAGPWFAWVHLFDPHAPYEAPLDVARDGRAGVARPAPQNPATTAYDNEVAYVDASLGRFFAKLRPAIDRAVVLVTADHGESLGEHGESTHGLFAYDSTLRVPLLVAGPGIASRVATEAVSHIDIMPTILDLTGAGAAVDGRSLVGALRGAPLADQPVYFEALDAALTRGWAPLTGVIAGGWKYIDLPLPELYNLSADREERANLVTGETARTTLLQDLARRIRSVPERSSRATALADADARARLRALGYAGGALGHLGAWRPEDDPKRLLPLHRRFQHAADEAARNPDAAIRELRALISERPEFAAAYEAAATLLLETGRPRDAIVLLSQAQSRGLNHRALAERMGAALLASGDAGAAVALLERATALEPDALEVRHTFALALIAAGDHKRARDVLTTILRLDPAAPDVWTNIGTLDLQRGAMREAQHAFERALAGDPRSVAALKGLGASQETLHPARAAQQWERALALAPNDHQLLARLAFLLAKSDPARAQPYLERLIREAPNARFASEKQRARELLAQIKVKGR